MRPRARNVILDLLSTLPTGTMPVAALVEAGALFGIPGNNTRVAITRLLAEGRIARDERGRYRLGPAAHPVSRRLSGWRHPDRATRPWDGSWIAVRASCGGDRRERRRRERALRLLGLGELEPGFFLRPANLRRSVDELRDDLRDLGLPRSDLVFRASDLDSEAGTLAARLWDADGIRSGHRRLRADIERSTLRLGRLPAGEAMVESFLVGGAALRALVLDPLLPDEICPTGERQTLAAAMRDYDRLGRSAWAAFLASYDVPHRKPPMDTRFLDEPVAVNS